MRPIEPKVCEHDVVLGMCAECEREALASPEPPMEAKPASWKFDPAALMSDEHLREFAAELDARFPDGSGSIQVSPWLVRWLIARALLPDAEGES